MQSKFTERFLYSIEWEYFSFWVGCMLMPVPLYFPLFNEGMEKSLRLHFRSLRNVPSTFAAFWRSSLCSSMRVHNTMRCVVCLPVVASCCATALHCTTAKSESVLWTSYPPVMRIRTYERAYAIESHVWKSHARASIDKNFVHARMLNNLINAIEWIIIGIIVEAINWMSIMR